MRVIGLAVLVMLSAPCAKAAAQQCAPCALPDLVPRITQDGRSTVTSCNREGNDQTLVVYLVNIGKAKAGSFDVRVHLRAQSSQGDRSATKIPTVDPKSVKELAPESKTVSIRFRIPRECFMPTCAFRVWVDSSDAILESNRGNNVVTGSCSAGTT
jgi:subtilase family serine protease